ncbi:MAG: hypothetical protein JO299_20530, partial [Gammaproteobacteria bacterium]|nr:hypothetical protein [Gammaproteobacteria bacterium]
MALHSSRALIWLALLGLSCAAVSPATAAGSAAPGRSFGRTADPLESAKTAIRLKNFASAQSDLQRLAEAGNPDAQYLLASFHLNGLAGPRDLT